MQNHSQCHQTLTTPSSTPTSTSPQKLQTQLTQLSLLHNPTNTPDLTQLSHLLNSILAYPNIQQAQLHMQANRLGVDDLRSEVKIRNQCAEVREKMELCLCCGFVRQKERLRLRTHLEEINNVGVSTYLYFRAIKNLGILVLILMLSFSVYSIITNIKASQQYQKIIQTHTTITPNLLSTLNHLTISLGSKQLNPTQQNKHYYKIQCQIGVGVILAWFAIFFVLKYIEKKQERILDMKTISASDFTIMMENVPRDVGVEEIQEMFREYQGVISGGKEGEIGVGVQARLNIVKINVGRPFYLSQLDLDDKELNQLRQKHKKYIQTFITWIKQRQTSPQFTTPTLTRQTTYTQFQTLLKTQTQKQQQLYQSLTKKLKNKNQSKSQIKSQTTTIFITFQTSSAMKIITNLNNSSFASKIRYWIGCCRGSYRFRFVRGGVDYKVRIQRAPEPEDIIWSNIGVPTSQNIKRKLLTYTITFTILTISFIIVYFLSKAQQTTSSNIYLSLLISLTISSINVILALVIRKISAFQKDQTKIRHQRSFAVKSICANMINTIIIPILVNYYIKQDIYGRNGLANDIFMLGLTNSFVSPILKLIDLTYIINRIRKHIISKPNNRLQINQVTLNQSFQYPKFQVGDQYVYLVSLFLFTCFFVSLQPIVSIFALCGFGMMYWVQKYSLFNKMKRPIPGTNLVNAAMFQIVLSGGLVFSLGNLTWSNFMPNGIPEDALFPNVIGLGIGLFVFMVPYGTILALILGGSQDQNLNFYENRVILSSEYDRLNPVTSVEAMKQFQEFFLKKTVGHYVEDNQMAKMKQFNYKNIQSSKRLSLRDRNSLGNLLEITPFLIQRYQNSMKKIHKQDDLEETQNNMKLCESNNNKNQKTRQNVQFLNLLQILNQNNSEIYPTNQEQKSKQQQSIHSIESSINNDKKVLTYYQERPLSINIS